MVTLERRVAGVLRYRRVFFPDREAAWRLSQSLRPNDIVRIFGVDRDLGELFHLVKHQLMLTTCLDLSQGCESALRGMKKKSCRYEIRRAEKMLDKIEIEVNSPKALRDFLPLYNSFAETKGPVPQLSARRLAEYAANGDVLVLYLDHRPMCCHFLLRDVESRTVRLIYSGSRRLETSEDAAMCGVFNRYLHWQEIRRYHSQGILTYDFGGIRYVAHPTARFKLSFGGAVVTQHYYLLGGTQWLAKLGNAVYEKCFKSAAPALDEGNPGKDPSRRSYKVILLRMLSAVRSSK